MSNKEYSPKDDFYQWVNHEWLNDPKNEIPSEYSTWGGFMKLYDEGLKNQINLVSKLDSKSESIKERKISRIWKASMDRFDVWEKGEGNYFIYFFPPTNPKEGVYECCDDYPEAVGPDRGIDSRKISLLPSQIDREDVTAVSSDKHCISYEDVTMVARPIASGIVVSCDLVRVNVGGIVLSIS